MWSVSTFIHFPGNHMTTAPTRSAHFSRLHVCACSPSPPPAVLLFTLLGGSSHVTSCSLPQAPRQNSPSETQRWVDSASKAMLRQHHIVSHKHVFPSRFLSSGRASAVFVSSAQHNPWRKGHTRLDELNWILEFQDWEEPKRPTLLSNVHVRLK